MPAIKFAPLAGQLCAAPSDDATISLGAALDGFSQLRLHIASGETASFLIRDGTVWEESYGVLTHGAPDTLTRTVLRNSSGTTDRIDFPGSADVISFPSSTKTIVLDTANAAAFPGTVSASNGTTGTNVVNWSQFATAAGSGYITHLIPGGYRETTGSTLVTTDGSGNATITFPVAFTANPIVVVSNGDATQTTTSVHLVGQNFTAFQVNCPDRISSTFRVNWIAKGAA